MLHYFMKDKMLKQLIVDKRRKSGLSLSSRDIAKEIDVSHSTIIRALRGDDIDLPTLIAFAEWLEVKPSTLLNSFAHSKDQVADEIALVIEREPKLREAFSEALKAIEA